MNACGYTGSYHFCAAGVVRFISRYRGVNDYCVGGKRVSIGDDGVASDNATLLDLHAIYGFELRKHEEYLQWHAASPLMQATNPSPFDSGITSARLTTSLREFAQSWKGEV